MTNIKRILWGIILTVILIMLGGYYLIHQSLQPYWQARKETIAIAKEKEDLKSPDQFYWHNGDEATFAITGKNSDDEQIIVVVTGEEAQTTSYLLKNIYPEEEAIQQMIAEIQPEEILESRVAWSEEDGPLWEISFKDKNGRLGYYLVSLIDGLWLKTIDNI